jgi:hypothetical protein
MVCNASGDGHEETTCLDEDENPVWCIQGACAECIPGAQVCKDDNTVLECNETGVFEEAQSCSGELTGQVCLAGACVKLCEVNKKFNSYIGCDYWAVDLDNAMVPAFSSGTWFDAAGAQFALVVSNPHTTQSALVTIHQMGEEGEEEVLLDSAGDALDRSPVPPGQLRIYNLPRRDVMGTVLAPLAYRMESSIPVTAHQFNPLDNSVEVFSNDASLLLPSDGLGKVYVVMSREQTFPGLRGFLTVVAISDNTSVSVTVTAPTLAVPPFEPLTPGEGLTVQMNRYDVLNIETDAPGADLTGSIILASKDVAVFGGSQASNAPNTATCLPEGVCEWDGATPCETLLDCIEFNTCCADHLEQQMFPVKTWGTTFVATQTQERGAAQDIWRILAAENGTQVKTVPSQGPIPVLDRGEWHEFESNEHFMIESKKPIMVGQFLAAEDAPDPNVDGPGADDANIGDPAFMLAVPVEQYREDYVVLAPNAYEQDHINITAPHDASVFLDGDAIPSSEWEPVSATYRVARLSISDGEHVVESDQKVGVAVYGFDKYVSYAYPGGLDLKDLGLLQESWE